MLSESINIDIGLSPYLYRAAHSCMKRQNEEIRDMAISSPQAVVLGAILLSETELNQKILSEKIGVKESSISSIVKTMIKNGFISKEKSSKDGRNYILKVTDKGLKVCKELDKKIRDFEEILYKDFTEEDKETLKNLLIRLI